MHALAQTRAAMDSCPKMQRPASRFAKASVFLVSLLFSAVALAQSNPFERGPEPSVSSLEAKLGPFTVASMSVRSPSGYGGGTIYYPTNVAAQVGAIAVAPGFNSDEKALNWWGPRLASNGFVVITLNTHCLFDYAGSRADQLMSALKQVVVFSNTRGNPLFGLLDGERLGVMGWSMGGGGSLIAARDNPKLKAVAPLAPWTLGISNVARNVVPTMMVACASDPVTPPALHALPSYKSVEKTKKAYLSIAGTYHYCAINDNRDPGLIGKYGVAWMKRFIDNDTRYSPYLCGAPHKAGLSSPRIGEYRENCDY